MVRKIYFIVASIISFLLSIYSIVVANETVKATIDEVKAVYSGFPQSFLDRVIGIYENSGVKMIVLFAIIVIISSILIFIFAKNNTLLKHKGLVITLSSLSFFFTDRLFVQLFAIASIIIMICSKRKNPEDFPDKTKKTIPKLEIKQSSLKDMLLGILLVVVYFSQFIWSRLLPDDFTIILIEEILFNVVMILLCIIIFYKDLIQDFKLFKNNIKAYMRFIMPRLGMAYLFLFIASIISILVTKNAVSVNQETLESLPKLYSIPAAIIYAPIVEEIIFRGVLRRIIKNNILFIIASALVFGLLHTIGETSLLNIFIMGLPYISLGAYLAYIYTKTNNIWSNITSHAIFNTVSSVFILFI